MGVGCGVWGVGCRVSEKCRVSRERLTVRLCSDSRLPTRRISQSHNALRAHMPLRINPLILALLLASTASAADLHDVTSPSRINAFFPRHAKIRVVNIWATWCVPCVAEMPDLRMINGAFGPELTMVGVSMDDM